MLAPDISYSTTQTNSATYYFMRQVSGGKQNNHHYQKAKIGASGAWPSRTAVLLCLGRFKQTQRTDNLRLLYPQLFVDLAEAIVCTQVDDQ